MKTLQLTAALIATIACLASPLASAAPVAGKVGHAASTNSAPGIEIQSLRASAHGYMIDLRYKVLDGQKADMLTSREIKPYIIDAATGAKLLIPNTPKVGPLRQMAKNANPDRVYFSLFSNPGKIVKPGSKVTVVIGDVRVENLLVE